MWLSSFRIDGFKNLRSVELFDLGPINVLHGRNNVGKSNIVEAIGLLFHVLGRIFRWSRAGALRSESVTVQSLEDAGFRNLFPFDGGSVIRLSAVVRFAAEGRLRLGREQDVEIERVRVSVQLERSGTDVDLRITELLINDRADLVPIDGDRSSENADPRWNAYQVVSSALVNRGMEKHNVPTFGLIAPDRSYSMEPRSPLALRGVLEGARGRDLVPADLCLKLFDARESSEPVLRDAYERFVETMDRFRELLGEGRFEATYQREQDRAFLTWQPHNKRYRIPSEALGTGPQQLATLLGRLIIETPVILAIEEPELDLSYLAQLQLREAFRALVGKNGGVQQIFLTSHSPAFESGDAFYAVTATPAGPHVEKRPVAEALRFTACDIATPPDGKRAPLCYVTSEGLVRLPQFVQEKLEVLGGGGIAFLERRDGFVEVLSDNQYLSLMDDDQG